MGFAINGLVFDVVISNLDPAFSYVSFPGHLKAIVKFSSCVIAVIFLRILCVLKYPFTSSLRVYSFILFFPG